MSTLEDTIRQSVREEVRTVVREEVRAALAELKPAATGEALLTVEQVAQRAGGVKPETVRGWIRTGKLEARRAGHRFLVTSQALDALLAGVARKGDLPDEQHLSLLIDRIDSTTTKRSKR